MLLRWFVLVVTVGLLAAPPPAGAVRVRARFPAVVTTGALVRVPGRVSGSLQVRLEQRVRGGWVRRGAGRHFPLRWRAPRAAGVAGVRVVALRGRRVAGYTGGRRVARGAPRGLSPAPVWAAPAARGGVARFSGAVSPPPRA